MLLVTAAQLTDEAVVARNGRCEYLQRLGDPLAGRDLQAAPLTLIKSFLALPNLVVEFHAAGPVPGQAQFPVSGVRVHFFIPKCLP